jgi:hypothetical protein
VAVTFGRTCPDGFLPAYSVEDEAEAYDLILATCEYRPGVPHGHYVAPDLVAEQTLDNLAKFAWRLHKAYQRMKADDSG